MTYREETDPIATVIISLILFTVVAGIAWLGYDAECKRQIWLRDCAKATHGWVEREYVGETIHRDDKGNQTSTSANFNYYVRTPSGRRINYGDDYSAE